MKALEQWVAEVGFESIMMLLPRALAMEAPAGRMTLLQWLASEPSISCCVAVRPCAPASNASRVLACGSLVRLRLLWLVRQAESRCSARRRTSSFCLVPFSKTWMTAMATFALQLRYCSRNKAAYAQIPPFVKH